MLRKLDVNKVSDPDEIYAIVLRNCAPELSSVDSPVSISINPKKPLQMDNLPADPSNHRHTL